MAWSRVLFALAFSLSGCAYTWKAVDDDGDGVTVADGDCWDAVEGPSGTGLSGADILAAGTSTPAAYWGLSELGSLEVGKAASLLVLSADPTQKPEVLATPLVVIIDGKPR